MRFGFVLACCLLLSSCLDNKPLENDLASPEKMSVVLQALQSATRNSTPESMSKGEWALFQLYARLYTTPYQSIGYTANQVLSKKLETVVIDETSVNLAKIDVLATDYGQPKNPEDTPPISLQKEWKCDFARDPYYFWINECELTPYQNFLLFYPIQVNDNLLYFYNLNKYTEKIKLPQILVSENRCYNFENCEYEATVIEFDLITYKDGTRKRMHVTNWFNPQLPYLATNPKQCLKTLVEIDGQMHPYEVCRELINFKYGE